MSAKFLMVRAALGRELDLVAEAIKRGAPLNEQANVLHELERRARDLHAAEVRTAPLWGEMQAHVEQGVRIDEKEAGR